MKKPVIGITSDTGFLEKSDKYLGLEINFSQKVFSDAIFQAGGIPHMLPMNAGEYAEDIMSVLDGLIIIGGHDVSPLAYNQEIRAKNGPTKPERDDNDTRLFKAAMENEIPVLGVCRGHQLINVILGGTLYQDLSEYSEYSETVIQHDQQSKPKELTHKIKFVEDTYSSGLFEKQIWVNSVHHQMVDDLSPELIPTAWSTDQIIEGFESKEETPLIIGVQWHPEVLFEQHANQLGIFKDLIERAKVYQK